MEATITTTLIATLFFTLIIKGSCIKKQCSVSDIKVVTKPTGLHIDEKPERMVTVENNCGCEQGYIQLDCRGFQTSEDVDSHTLRVMGDACLLIDGNTLPAFTTVTFFYAWWDPPFLFTPFYTTGGIC